LGGPKGAARSRAGGPWSSDRPLSGATEGSGGYVGQRPRAGGGFLYRLFVGLSERNVLDPDNSHFTTDNSKESSRLFTARPPSPGMHWGDLFERADEYRTDVATIRETLADRRAADEEETDA